MAQKAASKPSTAKKKTKGQSDKEQQQEREKQLAGFVFPEAVYKDKTPLNYQTDPKTGLRIGSFQGPWSIAKHDLRDGIEGATLPPLFIWKEGRWLNEFEEGEAPLSDIQVEGWSWKDKNTENAAYSTWVVHGEGTPGEYVFRAYLLPFEVVQNKEPQHPVLWAAALKKGKASSFMAKTRNEWSSRPLYPYRAYRESWDLLAEGFITKPSLYEQGPVPSSTGYTGGYTAPKTATPPVPKAPVAKALPAGIRFRHQCGHWFKESDLAAHSQVCSTGENEAEADWAIMCDDKCGCELIQGFPSADHTLGHKTLDHVSRCKPGYPRGQKEEKPSSSASTNEPSTEPSNGSGPTS